MKKAKWLSALLAGAMMMTVIPATALATESGNGTGETIEIDSNDDLIAAIKNQKDNQVWSIAPGTYDIGDACTGVQANMGNVESGFVFPIFADNLTIQGTGTGNVTITSSYDPNSGNWQVQNFITISGENVTIQDVDLQANKNSFYDTCNKVIELVDDAKNFKRNRNR